MESPEEERMTFFKHETACVESEAIGQGIATGVAIEACAGREE
jgi:hypothetical protein